MSGSHVLTDEQRAQMRERYGVTYTAVETGEKGLPRRDRRKIARLKPEEQPGAFGTIGILSGRDTTHRAFTLSLMGLDTSRIAVTWARGADIANSRNRLARHMDGDWLWFLDDDHDFTPDLLPRLLLRDVDIVAPVVLSKVPPFSPVCYRDIGDPIPLSELPNDELVEVAATGTAGMLIRRRVFDTLDDPWFETGRIHADTLGEDLHFCVKAREAGFKVHVDTGAWLGHLTTTSVRPVMGEQWDVGLGFDQTVLRFPAP